MCSLLCLLPLGASGQTAAPYVGQRTSDDWHTLLTQGGIRRSQSGWYMQLPNGLSDLLVMNFVDGYSVGPHAIWGHVNQDRSRWELEETLRWTENRKRWVGKASLRYIWPVEWQSFISIYGGQHMEDFDEEPLMPQHHSLMASGLFGWNEYKLLERTQAGVRVSSAVATSMLLTGDVRWERRREKENNRKRNAFGVEAESNVPRIRYESGDRVDESLIESDRLRLYQGPVDAELMKASIQMDLLQDPTLYVIDDMTGMLVSHRPHYTAKLDMGHGVGHRWSDMRFLSLDLSMMQAVALTRELDQIRYKVGAGAMWKHGEVGLADWHHLDASRFWWQRSDGLTRFALLGNYELSTDQWWSEAHVEWSSMNMLLTHWTMTPELRETLQLHVAKVADHPVHWEGQYGWDMVGQLKLGVTVGFDGMNYSGVAFGLTLQIPTSAPTKGKNKKEN